MLVRQINAFKRILWRMRQQRGHVLALLFSLFVSFLLAETVVRVGSFDWRLINRMLYYQKADYKNHMAVDSPQMIYRLKPGTYDYDKELDGYQVTINSLGFRGPERKVEKSPGEFRIVVVGGSNVYGLGLNNGNSWPDYLEQVLNEFKPGRYQVWNLGVCAYVGSQMAAMAQEAVERYSPDLIIYALSNGGPAPFLWGTEPRSYFSRDWRLWYGLFDPSCLTKGFLPYKVRIQLIRFSRLYRYIQAYLAVKSECNWVINPYHEQRNVERTRKFFAANQGRVEICGFLFPGYKKVSYEVGAYFENTDVPVLTLSAEGKGPEYRNIHPPPYVMKWYAEEIASWLRDQGLLY